VYENPLHVYHIQEADASPGVSEKNAAETFGERTFLFDDGARGFMDYYDSGVIELVYTSYTHFGPYAHCNHVSGSDDYHCDNQSPYVGYEHNEHSGGTWYSFAEVGEGQNWHQGDCPSVKVAAKTVIDKLATAGNCGGVCGVASPNVDCANCILAMSDATYKQVWDAEFGNPTKHSTGYGNVTDMVI